MSQSKHIHFVGIGGSGMSAIAKVMVELGYRVTGSDLYEYELIQQLRTQGINVFIGHDEQNVTGADYVVYSSGIPKDNIELVTAEHLNIPLLHRSHMLAQLLNEQCGIAITGAHGKTTTSSMITYVMTHAGLDPTFLIGGEVLDFGYNARAGKSEFVVAEADESDGSFLKYYPKLAVITNIEEDHLENYMGSFEQLKDAYIQFIQQIKEQGTLVLCLDDCNIQNMLEKDSVQQAIRRNTIDLITYGLENTSAKLWAADIQLLNRSSSFIVYHQGLALGEVALSIPGRYNIWNALACIGIGLKLGIPFEKMKLALKTFVGAKRRFQVISEAQDIIVVDDYAHHPTEIMATIDAAKSTGRKIMAIFQPQRYTRTYFLLDAFSYAFAGADQVVITDIYSPSGEKPIEGVSSQELTQRIYKNSNVNVIYLSDYQEIIRYTLEHVQPGDLVLTIGAGDIWKVAYELGDYYTNLDQSSE